MTKRQKDRRTKRQRYRKKKDKKTKIRSGWSRYAPLKILSKVNEVAVEARRKRKAGRAGPVELDMTLALETLLPEDTTQYYYYQVSV